MGDPVRHWAIAPAESVQPLPEDTLIPRPGRLPSFADPPSGDLFQEPSFGDGPSFVEGMASGVRLTWQPRSSEMSVGAACFVAAVKLGLERSGDTPDNVYGAVGSSALRASAWLRARGAAVGHAVRRRRLHGEHGSLYQLAAQTPVSRKLSRGAVSFGRVDAPRIASWMRFGGERRVAILFVGPSWPSCHAADLHALVAVQASEHALTIFDPGGHGSLDEVRFGILDRLRGEGDACAEVIFVARRSID